MCVQKFPAYLGFVPPFSECIHYRISGYYFSLYVIFDSFICFLLSHLPYHHKHILFFILFLYIKPFFFLLSISLHKMHTHTDKQQNCDEQNTFFCTIVCLFGICRFTKQIIHKTILSLFLLFIYQSQSAKDFAYNF